MASQTLLAIEKNAREEIRLTLSDFKGSTYADLRVWYEPRDGGDRKPTREGVALRPDQIAQVIAALESARAELGKASSR